MLGYLILLFTIVPVAELAILIKVGQYMGVGYTVAIVVITGIGGAYLARQEGFITLRKIQEDINEGKMPQDRLFDGVLILCSGILLLTPGFVTDLIGFMGLIPFTRDRFKRLIKRKIKDMINQGKIAASTSFTHFS